MTTGARWDELVECRAVMFDRLEALRQCSDDNQPARVMKVGRVLIKSAGNVCFRG
jgi:hypothetical protein